MGGGGEKQLKRQLKLEKDMLISAMRLWVR